MLKKLSAVLLLLATLLSLASCGKNKYPPKESTEEENRVVMTLSLEGKTYNVKYELYRAFFLNYKSVVDGGDASVWTSENRAEYIDKIDSMIVNSVCDIYSTLHHADKLGLNPYSAAVDDKIEEYITGSVDGYDDGEMSAIGFDGDYDKYLESLHALGLNYSVQTLLFRYGIASDKIYSYYRGNVDDENPTPGMTDGALKYTLDDVRAYYHGNDSSRVLLTTLDKESYLPERAEEIRNTLASYTNENDIFSYIMNFTLTDEADAKDGIIIGKYSLDAAYYSALTDEALALSVGAVSRVIPVTTENGSFYYILYRKEKSEEHLERRLLDIEASYVNNEIGKLISTDKAGLFASVKYTDVLLGLDRAAISMP